MPRYLFRREGVSGRGVAEEFPDDRAAKAHACVVADEINRNAERPTRVLVLDEDGTLVAAVAPTPQ